MDPTLLGAMSGVLGSLVGGSATVATAWITQRNATQRDLMADLPRSVVGVDFEPLPVASLEQVRNAFVNTSGGAVAQETFHVQAK